MKIDVTAYPYTVTYGTIEVPDDTEDIHQYIAEHFDEINFGSPDLDYCGTDFRFTPTGIHASQQFYKGE